MRNLFNRNHITRYTFVLFVTILSFTACKKKDANVPVVTLKGDADINLALNSVYVEDGATANDIEDGNLTVEISGSVNTDFEGLYIITYNATDAAGNRGEALRVVHVNNEASTYCGNFTLTSLSTSDTTIFPAILSTSTTLNHRVWIEAFAHKANAVVYADITDNMINIPKQTNQLSGITHYFSGIGTISILDTLKIQLSFMDSTSGNVINGQSTYKIVN